MIVSGMLKHPTTLANATRVYVEATSSSILFLIAENERIVKEVQMSRRGGELVTSSTQAKLKKVILDEVFSLDTFMRALYSKFGTVHKAVVHLNGWEKHCVRSAHILLNMHATIDYMQTWIMRYKGTPSHLPKMMKPRVVKLNACIQS